MYSLVRSGDGAGDSGLMSESIEWKEDGQHIITDNSRPILGQSMRVGSFLARTYSAQDWWLTTPVSEILEDNGNEVIFKTGNSVYTWKNL